MSVHTTIGPPPPRRVAAWTARLARRRYRPGAPSPCHPAEWLVANPWEPGKVICPEEGRHFLAAI